MGQLLKMDFIKASCRKIFNFVFLNLFYLICVEILWQILGQLVSIFYDVSNSQDSMSLVIVTICKI